jgi:hypothetical protein
MLRATPASRYAVKLSNFLPHEQAIACVLARSFTAIARQCNALVSAVQEDDLQTELVPWQNVRRMQATSYFHVLRQLLEGTGVTQVERLFEKESLSVLSLAKDKGCGRKLRRGEHIPNQRTIARNAQRLSQLRGGDLIPIGADLFQLLWLVLLTEIPIADAAPRYLKVHSAMEMELIFEVLDAINGQGFFNLQSRLQFNYGSLPRLAGYITVLRQCAETGARDEAHLLAQTVCRMLALLGPELFERGIGASLIHYCTKYVLPLGNLAVSPLRIAQTSALLNLTAMSTTEHLGSSAVPWKKRSELMASILRGEFGPDLQQICDPTTDTSRKACWEAIRASELHRIKLSLGYPTGRPWWLPEGLKHTVLSVPQMLLREPAAEQWGTSEQSSPHPPRRREWFDGLCGTPTARPRLSVSDAAAPGSRPSSPASSDPPAPGASAT